MSPLLGTFKQTFDTCSTLFHNKISDLIEHSGLTVVVRG